MRALLPNFVALFLYDSYYELLVYVAQAFLLVASIFGLDYYVLQMSTLWQDFDRII